MNNNLYRLIFLLLIPHSYIVLSERRSKRAFNLAVYNLNKAIVLSDVNRVKHIIKHHPDRRTLLNTLNSRERFPLEVACQYSSKKAILQLLQSGANPNSCDKNEYTPLKTAIKRGSPNIVKVLLKYGAQATSPDRHPSLLGLSVSLEPQNKCYYRIARYLLQNDANANRLDHTGKSPYMLAALVTSNQQFMALLEKYGANPLTLSLDQKSALEYASSEKKRDIAYTMEQKISAEEQSDIISLLADQTEDPITGDLLLNHDNSELIILNGRVYLKDTLTHHILLKIGTDKGPCDPFSNQPIPKKVILRIAAHARIPYYEVDCEQRNPSTSTLVSIARLIVPRESALSIMNSEEEDEESDSQQAIFGLAQIEEEDETDDESDESNQDDRETYRIIQREIKILKAQFYDKLRLSNPQLADSIYPQVQPYNMQMYD